MNSNNENNNEGLNAVSLGSIDSTNQNLNVPISDIPPVVPMPMEDQMETLDEELPMQEVSVEEPVTPEVTNVSEIPNVNDVQPVAPIAQSEVPIDINSIPTDVSPLDPVEPISYDIPEVIDNGPVFNDIGTVPPISNGPIINDAIAEPATPETPKKKGMNKVLFVIIILLALAMVGGGVYVFLNKANDSKPLVVTKVLKIERGSELSTDIKDYATFKNIDSSTCNLDTTEITDTKTLEAEYKFRITCGNSTYIGKATIVDTTAPDVTLREVNVGVNEEITAEDFIAECKDASECTYTFKDELKVQEYLKETSSYHVPIIVKDEAGNEKEVTGILNVSESVSTVSLVCNKVNDNYLLTDKLGLFESEFNKSTIRTYTFTFDDNEEYEKVRDENKDKTEMTYLDVTGTPKFDDDEMILTITKKVTYGDLNSEFGSEVPLAFGELKVFFEDRDYVCSIGY